MFSSVSGAFGRTTQKVMVKMGQAEETTDIAMNSEITKLQMYHKRLKAINEHSKKVTQCLKDLALAQSGLMEEFLAMHESCDAMYPVCSQMQHAFQEMDQARLVLEESWKDDFNTPLAAFIGQFNELDKRVAIRDKRRVDMDRYRAKVRKASEKAQPEVAKLNALKEQQAIATAAYKEINTELFQDIPRLYTDRVECLQPIIATLVFSWIEFYSSNGKSMGRLQPLVQHIDRHAAGQHPRVITEPDVSCAYKEPDMNAYREKESDARASRASDAQAYVPASSAAAPTSYASQQPVAAAPYSQPQNAYASEPHGATPGGPGYGKPVGKPVAKGPGGPGAVPMGANKGAPKPMGKPGAKASGRAMPSPGGPQAKALFPFEGQDHTELSFQPGDIITVHSQNGEWWEGEINGRRGLFPFNYVQLL